MKKKKIIVTILIILIFGLILIPNALCCSMFKLTMYGKTMVGNNEDFWNPNTRIWFEQGKANEYGAIYVGYDNFWPQGGMNQAGLVFDGFSMDYLVINDTLGKKSLGANFLRDIMKKCTVVDDVKKYFTNKKIFNVYYSAKGFVDIKRETEYNLSEFEGQKSLVVCGIANPYSFFTALRQTNVDTENYLIFRDHKYYTNKEVQRIRKMFYTTNSHSVVTTQKDAVKFSEHQNELDDIDIFYLKIELVMDESFSFKEFLLNKIVT